MSDATQPRPGTIGWIDLTVDDAESIRDFYHQVVGWQPSPVEMTGYSDFNMNEPESGEPTAGVCHKRGNNADLPSCWMIYVIVADLKSSLASVRALGGEVIAGPKTMGQSSGYAVIRDPAGAVLALYQPAD